MVFYLEVDDEQDKKKASGRQRMMTGIRFLVSFGALGIIVALFREQIPTVFSHLARADLTLFGLSLLLYFIGLIFIARRLQGFLHAHDTRFSLVHTYYVNLIALFFNNILPSSLGGEAVKAYYIYQKGSIASVGAVLVDRLFGLLTLIGIGIAAPLFFRNGMESAKIINSVAVMAAVTAPMVIIIFSRKIGSRLTAISIPFVPTGITGKFQELFRAIHFYRGKTGILLGSVVLSLCAQFFFVLANFLLAKSLFLDIPLQFFFFFIPISSIVHVAPSINGVGVREATYLFYLREFTTPDQAFALSLLTTFSLMLIGVIGGLVYAFSGDAGMRRTGEAETGRRGKGKNH